MDPDSDREPDPAPDPALFIIALQDADNKQFFEGTFTSFFKTKSHKKVPVQ
jgi:hypothetical protein